MNHRKIVAAVLVLLCVTLHTPTPARAAQENVHILLIGSDGVDSQGGANRSDTVLLCSYLPESGQLVMTSFLRDLYLPIPGHGSNRLNAAYALGGRELLCDTLEQNFGIEADGCVEVDFERFAQIIDTVGGVSIRLRQDEAARINKDCPGSQLTEGSQLLTGAQALCYSRIRSLDPDGDFSRTRRQQAVLQALLRQWRHADTWTLLEAVRKLIPMVSTDLSPAQILRWATNMAPSMSELKITGLQVPAAGTCRDEIRQGMAVLVADLHKNKLLLESILKAS